MPPTQRPELWPAQKYANIFGLRGATRTGEGPAAAGSSAAAAAAGSRRAAREPQAHAGVAAMLDAPFATSRICEEPAKLTKGQKKNAKKKQKKAAAKVATAREEDDLHSGDQSVGEVAQRGIDEGAAAVVGEATASLQQLNLA